MQQDNCTHNTSKKKPLVTSLMQIDTIHWIMSKQAPLIKQLGLQDYATTWQAMRDFTDQRTRETEDQVWILEHPPVFTQGYAGKAEHILDSGDIPIVQTDRGGQVTYHGPGQLVAYILHDLRRSKLNIRQLVRNIEAAVIATLTEFNIPSETRCDAPGVYVNQAKICSLGLRVRRGCSYHGLALNVNMDLSPFQRINPCGFTGLTMTQIKDHGGPDAIEAISPVISHQLQQMIGNTS